MSLDEIEAVLRERTASGDDDVFNAWEVVRNDVVTRVKAATKEVFATALEACEAADELAGSLLRLGYHMARESEIGAVRLDQEPAVEWRGRVVLVLHGPELPPADGGAN